MAPVKGRLRRCKLIQGSLKSAHFKSLAPLKVPVSFYSWAFKMGLIMFTQLMKNTFNSVTQALIKSLNENLT